MYKEGVALRIHERESLPGETGHAAAESPQRSGTN